MRVVFFGSPEFAVPSLEALLGEGFEVLAVVSQPDRPHGRSWSQPVAPPVKRAAQEEDVPVLQPERPTDPAFVSRLAELAPDIGVVVAYGHILKPELLAIPRLGMVNLHPSLLPKLRGAAPIEWAIINGLDQTGVSIMQMDAGMDSGPVLHQIAEPLPADITGGELAAHLSEIGAEAMVEALSLLAQGTLTPRRQIDADATYAPKLSRDGARVNWSGPPLQIERLIRALDPRPGAWTELNGRAVKVFGPGSSADGRTGKRADGAAGTVLEAGERLVVATGAGPLAIEEVQPEGKARMLAVEWVRGRGVEAGQRFQ
ncbi:MAG TPA: methionyl-tRNA formyltransferase [Gemmatimonadales bacterium]|nr:methionyl-tRNA formyltransferase [Gemmatimonadales bacterium]